MTEGGMTILSYPPFAEPPPTMHPRKKCMYRNYFTNDVIQSERAVSSWSIFLHLSIYLFPVDVLQSEHLDDLVHRVRGSHVVIVV